jgi:hypothetical protein
MDGGNITTQDQNSKALIQLSVKQILDSLIDFLEACKIFFLTKGYLYLINKVLLYLIKVSLP